MSITRIQLKSTEAPIFKEAWDLYVDSFPIDERRDLLLQKKIVANEAYHFDVLVQENRFVGILLWWEFDNLLYIEHLATKPELRGKGIGKIIIEAVISETSRPILLEVEKPEDDIKQRRIGFYQRVGFKLNRHDYIQPPYRINGNPVELLLMTYPHEISTIELLYFIKECHPIIHAETLKTH